MRRPDGQVVDLRVNGLVFHFGSVIVAGLVVFVPIFLVVIRPTVPVEPAWPLGMSVIAAAVLAATLVPSPGARFVIGRRWSVGMRHGLCCDPIS